MRTKLSPLGVTYVEALFRQYRGPLLRYITGLLPNPEDAAELLQETYVRLLRQQSLDRVDENARAYLFQVATNLVRDYFRQRKALHTDRHAPLYNSSFDAELQVPQTSVELDETLARFRRVLLSLPSQMQDVFFLYRFRGLNHRQIAEKLHLSTKTVERHMIKATSLLKRSLEEDV